MSEDSAATPAPSSGPAAGAVDAQLSPPIALPPEATSDEMESGSTVRAAVPASDGILKLLYTHNPFYLISACLFVYGLKKLFRQGDQSILFGQGSVAYMEPWGLALSLAAVTVLMTITAIVIVRVGKVWEDARSIVLIVLMMFLAISISFDELITVRSDRDNGHSFESVVALILMSYGFCVVLSELLIRGQRVRLSRSWRLPLYGFLGLFFCYPLGLLPEVMGFTNEKVRWLIAAFPSAASVLALTLIPAIRSGSSSVAENGTPWRWPWFPWTPFVLVAGTVCFRSYSLTISFDVPVTMKHFWDTTFGLYQLVPFLLAVQLLLLEISIVEKRRKLQWCLMLTASLLLLPAHPLIVPWHGLPAYRGFLENLTMTAASPLYLTILALGGFYAIAWWRGLRFAEFGFFAMTSLATIVPARVSMPQLASINWLPNQIWPIVLNAAVLLYISLHTRRSILAAISLVCIAWASHGYLVSSVQSFGLLPRMVPLITMHVVLLGLMGICLSYRDRFAEFLREVTAAATSLGMLVTVVQLTRFHAGVAVSIFYAVAVTATLFAAGRLMNNKLFFWTAAAHCLGGILLATGYGSWLFVRSDLPAGIKSVALAGLSFLVAIAISAGKSGMLQHCFRKKQTET
ncbi:MAG: hypothetical protein R3C20_11625 [Planctomycetaceae bacterium]